MTKIETLSKTQTYWVLGLITIAIIAFTVGLNDDVIYLWDRNIIPISDEGKTINVYLAAGATAKSCLNEWVCYEDTTDVWFNPGGQVTFHNDDSIQHTIASFSPNDDGECVFSGEDGTFDSGSIAPGESWTYRPPKDLYTNSEQSPIWTTLCYYDKTDSDFVGSITISPGYDIATLLYMSGSLIAAFASFRVSKHYLGGEMFPKAYLFLGLAFCSWFAGDMFFFYNDYVDDLPSLDTPYMALYDPRDDSHKINFQMEIADFVYLGIYPFMALHLYLNANYYLPKKSGIIKLAIFGIPLVGAIIFFLQFGAITYESIFGSLNAVGAAVTLGLVIYGAKVFNNTDLKPAWFLLLIGITISTIGDFLYYQVEDFNNNYAIYSTSTIMYVLAYMIMIYALYRHTKIYPAK